MVKKLCPQELCNWEICEELRDNQAQSSVSLSGKEVTHY